MRWYCQKGRLIFPQSCFQYLMSNFTFTCTFFVIFVFVILLVFHHLYLLWTVLWLQYLQLQSKIFRSSYFYLLVVDIPMCKPTSCHHLCEVVAGEVTCSCRTGFELGYDQKTCKGNWTIVTFSSNDFSRNNFPLDFKWIYGSIHRKFMLV